MRLNDGRALPALLASFTRRRFDRIWRWPNKKLLLTDLVEGIYRLLISDYTLPLNIGNPDEISLKDFAEEIIKLTGTEQKIIYKTLPTDDPKQRQPDITKAKEF
jgi:dTDP-glucose 4,6-dehydratase